MTPASMRSPEYSKHLQSAEWAALRAQIRIQANGLCERCGEEGHEAHHKHYRNLGRERMADLEFLCRNCHRRADRERLARTGGRCSPVDINRLAQPLLEPSSGLLPGKATELVVDRCDVTHARRLNAEWHSRLPETQTGPWMAAYRAAFDGVTYAVALWNSPSARTLPRGAIELRRMAVAPDAPHCTASRFLNEMVRCIGREFPAATRAVSYQDRDVHTGTIYKAAGWIAAYASQPRVRDRRGRRAGTNRSYRWNINGSAADSAGKVRWEREIAR